MNSNLITRQLIRSSSRGYLSSNFNPKNFKKISTNMKSSFPYSTFTMTAFDYDLSPILLMSDLSEHTTNLINDNNASLMLTEEKKLYKFFPKFVMKNIAYEDPMSRPRVTLIGKIKKTNNSNLKKRFLTRHPASKLYANFADMNIYKMEIKSAHLIGGFAQVKWFKKDDIICQNFKNFEQNEDSIVSHMNNEHQESVNLYINKFLSEQLSSNERKGNWKIVGVDPDGFDLRKNKILLRFPFEKQINDVKKLRGIFVGLHKKALNIN